MRVELGQKQNNTEVKYDLKKQIFLLHISKHFTVNKIDFAMQTVFPFPRQILVYCNFSNDQKPEICQRNVPKSFKQVNTNNE